MNNLFESAQFTGKNLVVLDSVDSTNKYASARLQSGEVKEGSAFLAEFQSEGRGQQGTVWESESGKNLIVSFVFYPQFLLATDQLFAC